MNKYLITFLSSFAIFIFFITPNVNSGDAGELVTASYYMGLAHPPGYPLYLQIGKFLTFLPFGNMAFKVAVMSAIFGSLSLTLVCWITFKLTESQIASSFTASILLVSYSFFTQSVIAKFYPLNLFIILVIFVLWVRVFLNGYDRRILYLITFLLGITTASHHTGFIMAAPVLFSCIIYRREIKLRDIFISLLLLFLGFLANSYILIRGSGGHFFNAIYVNSIEDFWKVFFRDVYKEGSTIAVAGGAAKEWGDYWFAFRNFVEILTTNFSIFSLLLFFAGIFYFYRTNRRLLIFALLALFFYGPFLAKLTYAGQSLSEKNYYISANQYFLPGITFFIVFAGAGFYQLTEWLKRSQLRIISSVIPLILAVFPLVFLVSRATDSNYRTNYVPYQVIKDMHSILPANSILLSFGDDAIFQGWYIKLIGRYRDDVCQPAVPSQKDRAWSYNGCNEQIYGSVYPEIYTRNLRKMVPLMLKKRFYGTEMLTDVFPYRQHMYSKVFSMAHLYLPVNKALAFYSAQNSSKSIDGFLNSRLIEADRLINPQVCVSHLTDDFLTRAICGRYIIHLSDIARLYSDERYGKTGKSVNVMLIDNITHRDDLARKLDVTEENKKYLALATFIQEHNKWKIFYLRETE